MPRRWMGKRPEGCDDCNRELKDFFVDGRLKINGRWAILCLACHRRIGIGLGLGKGQKYDLKTLEKVGG